MGQNYYSIGKKHGIAFKDEAIESIQAELEKQVSSYINRLSKRTAPLEAKLVMLQNNPQKKGSSIQEDSDEYDKIIFARAEANRRKSEKMRQNAVESALHAHKIYMASLEAFVNKAERKGDWQYQRFFFGVARNSGVSDHLAPVRFKSQVYLDYKEKLRREIGDHEN